MDFKIWVVTECLDRFKIQYRCKMLLHGNTYQPCLNDTSTLVCTKQWLSVLNDCMTQIVTNLRFNSAIPNNFVQYSPMYMFMG